MSMTNKPWTDDYLRQAIKDEIELAKAKMRRRVSMPSLITMMTDLYPDPPRGSGLVSAGAARHTLGASPLPRWRRSWSAAGPLIGELGLEIRHDTDEGLVSVSVAGERRGITEEYREHPSVDAAVMAALVRAATKAFNEARE